MRGRPIGEVLAQASRQLSPVSETPARDVQVLLAEMMGRPREWILAHPEAPVPWNTETQLHGALRRLTAGEPLPYVLGWSEFFGRRFMLTPEVLIPRPETEMLVAAALEVLDRSPAPRLLVDVGTGSGCIGITLALERPQARVVAVDLSRAALQVARHNATRLGVGERIALLAADLTLGLTFHEAVVVANLPYVATREVAALRGEPRLALDGGSEGLDVIRRFLQQLQGSRPSRTTVLLEIGAGQGEAVRHLASSACRPDHTELRQDLAGRDRLILLAFDGVQP